MKFFTNLLAILYFLLFLNSSVFGIEALDFVKSKIDYFNSLRQELSKNNTSKKRRIVRKKALNIAFAIVDIQEITKLALGKYYKKISASQVKEFQNLFHRIISEKITLANIPKTANYTKKYKMPFKILSSQNKKDPIFLKQAHIIKAQIKNKKIIYDIDIHLLKKINKFYVYDIHIDEASILLDFKNQFAKIIRTKGVIYLLKKMKKQVSKL